VRDGVADMYSVEDREEWRLMERLLVLGVVVKSSFVWKDLDD
jgi:hypothetical protein